MQKVITVRGHHFVNLLDSQSIILDLGANKGEFSTVLSRKFGCKCFAVEADPSLYADIPKNTLINKSNYIISDKSGQQKFYISRWGEASSVHQSMAERHGIKDELIVNALTLEDFLSLMNINNIDLLKIDIEGGEKGVFDSTKDNTLKKIRQITIEFHDFVGIPNESDVKKIIKRLKKLGFIVMRFSRPSHLFEDVLFVNAHLCRLAAVDRLYLNLFECFLLRIRHFLIYIQKRSEKTFAK